jgi:serine/threonine protein kinase
MTRTLRALAAAACDACVTARDAQARKPRLGRELPPRYALAGGAASRAWLLALCIAVAASGVAAEDDSLSGANLGLLVAIVVLGAATLFLIACTFRVHNRGTGAEALKKAMPMATETMATVDNPLIRASEVKRGAALGVGPLGPFYRARYRGLPVELHELTATPQLEADLTQLMQLRHPSLILLMGLCHFEDDEQGAASDAEGHRREPSGGVKQAWARPSGAFNLKSGSRRRRRLWLVTEHLEQGTLYSVLHERAVALDWRARVSMALSVAQALSFLHGAHKPVVHGALSAHTVTVSRDLACKVAYSGFNALARGLVVSKPNWTAPEVLRSGKDSAKSDVYSLGVLLWELMTRQVPFASAAAAGEVQLAKALAEGRAELAVPERAPPELAALLRACLSRDPARRPSAEQAVEQLQALLRVDFDVSCISQVEVKVADERLSFSSAAAHAPHSQMLQRPLPARGADDDSAAPLAPPATSPSRGSNGEGGEARRSVRLASLIDRSLLVAREELQLGDLVGAGSLGKVFLGTFRGKQVAVKQISVSRAGAHAQAAQFIREVNVMCSLRHPNTVLFMGACVDGDELLIVMEWCSRGSLHSVLRDDAHSVDYHASVRILVQIAQALNYLHLSSPPILHHDLKSLNILVDEDWNAKVADFGLTRFARGGAGDAAAQEAANAAGGGGGGGGGAEARGNGAGTLLWMAPEVLEGQPYQAASDVYSFGVIAWELFARASPFADMNPHQAVLAILTEDARPRIPDFVPPRMAELIGECWARDPARRPSFAQILERLDVIRREGVPRLELSLDNARLYRKRHFVHAFRCKDEVTVFKSWGTGVSKKGDWVIVGPDDDVYTCDAAVFAATYEPVRESNEPHTFRKVGRVLARQMPRAFLVQTLEGTEHGEAGDYLAQNPAAGEQWPIARDVFERMYEVAPDQNMPSKPGAWAAQHVGVAPSDSKQSLPQPQASDPRAPTLEMDAKEGDEARPASGAPGGGERKEHFTAFLNLYE